MSGLVSRIIRSYVRAGGGESGFSDVEFTYSSFDPLVITATFRENGQELNVWTLGRDLLMAGVGSPTPIGLLDIKCRAMRRSLVINLMNGQEDGWAEVLVPLNEIIRFLNLTTQMVGLGEENIEPQIDMALNAIREFS